MKISAALEKLIEEKGGNRNQAITQTAVKSLGFTDKLIKELLPEPKLVTNPHYKSAAPMKLWEISDVEEAMKNPVFQESLKKREKYKASAEKAVATKKAKLKEKTDRFLESIQIEQMDLDVLRKAAIEAKQGWYNYKFSIHCDGEPQSAYDADEGTVIRWMVNYVRHEMTSYDAQLYHMKGKVGIHDMYGEIHDVILDKIAGIYPELSQECERQKCSTRQMNYDAAYM